MKRKLYITLFSLLSLLLLGAGALYYYDYRSEQRRLITEYHFTPEELNSLESGDIIMRAGYGVLSESIIYKLGDSCQISHCGIIERDSSGVYVVHSMSAGVSDIDGMQRCDIDEFMKDSQENSVIVTRLKRDGDLVAKKAIYYLDKKLAFDHNFNLADTTTFYCSELIYRILYDELGIDLLKGKEHSASECRFSIFMNPEYFDVVINHPARVRED